MDPFVRRLVERLLDPGQPLSRNRHFHTFATPEGKRALAVSRRLQSLRLAVLDCQRRGGTLAVHRAPASRDVVLELAYESPRSRRVATLERQEFELLRTLPGLAAAL
jgi:hypothetical protein